MQLRKPFLLEIIAYDSYVLWVSSSEFSETANTKQEVFKTISGMLLSECPAPYTLIIPKPAFGLRNRPIALRLTPRPGILPRLATAEQQQHALVPRSNVHALLDMRQERGRLTRVLLVRLQKPGILTVSLPAAGARVNRMPGHHDEVPEVRERILPNLTRPRAAAPHRPEPGLVHGEEDQDAEAEGQQDEGDGHGVRLVEVADPHHDRGLEVRVLGLAALAGDPGLEVEVDASGVAEGLGAPRTESLAAAHRAQELGLSVSRGQRIKLSFGELRRSPDPKLGLEKMQV